MASSFGKVLNICTLLHPIPLSIEYLDVVELVVHPLSSSLSEYFRPDVCLLLPWEFS